jgi:Transposase DDE domain group 1
MRVCHGYTAVFDDPNLVSCAGLAPVLALAERAGLQRLLAEHVRIDKPGGRLAEVKVSTLVAGMVIGADSIDDMDMLRHGGLSRLFAGVRAPSTLGTFLRTFTFGHVRQLDAVASRLLIALAGQAPLLPVSAEIAYVDVDDTVRQTYGYAKQGAGRGYTGVKGLSALLAIVSTPGFAPVIAAARLRKGSTNSVKGAHRFVADALVTAKAAGATRVRVLRTDSAFYSHEVIAAARRRDTRFSIERECTLIWPKSGLLSNTRTLSVDEHISGLVARVAPVAQEIAQLTQDRRCRARLQIVRKLRSSRRGRRSRGSGRVRPEAGWATSAAGFWTGPWSHAFSG